MDSGKVAQERETHSRHAICSPDTAFLFLLVLTDLFKTKWQIASLWTYPCVDEHVIQTGRYGKLHFII